MPFQILNKPWSPRSETYCRRLPPSWPPSFRVNNFLSGGTGQPAWPLITCQTKGVRGGGGWGVLLHTWRLYAKKRPWTSSLCVSLFSLFSFSSVWQGSFPIPHCLNPLYLGSTLPWLGRGQFGSLVVGLTPSFAILARRALVSGLILQTGRSSG